MPKKLAYFRAGRPVFSKLARVGSNRSKRRERSRKQGRFQVFTSFRGKCGLGRWQKTAEMWRDFQLHKLARRGHYNPAKAFYLIVFSPHKPSVSDVNEPQLFKGDPRGLALLCRTAQQGGVEVFDQCGQSAVLLLIGEKSGDLVGSKALDELNGMRIGVCSFCHVLVCPPASDVSESARLSPDNRCFSRTLFPARSLSLFRLRQGPKCRTCAPHASSLPASGRCSFCSTTSQAPVQAALT